MFFSRDVLDCQDFEEKILVLLSKFEILKNISHFSFSSRLNEILQTDSLLKGSKISSLWRR